ncbi:MAG TPA: hypothetical protein VI968_01285 [archaeon]|nr:hypothetical protein [archaeon]
MSNKKRSKKGIESLDKQIKIHREKLEQAREKENISLVSYYEKEIEHFEQAKENLARRIMPKLKRKRI